MQEHHWNLIAKKLSGELSEKETEMFDKKMSKDKEFKEEYEQAEFVWNSAENNEDYDYNRIQKRIVQKINYNQKRKINKIVYTSFKYAAIFIGILIMSLSVFKDLNKTETVVNNTGKILKVTLPDNTVVALNKGSFIKYESSTIKKFNREVFVSGEAFFEVKKNNNQKFTVKTTAYNITVLGTKFNVRTYKNENSVVLTEGKVMLSGFKTNTGKIIMKPGEIVKYNAKDNTFIKNKINTEIYTSWMEKRLKFDNFSLYELAELLKIRYNKVLIIQDKDAAEKRISGSAPSDDVQLIIKALHTIFKAEITQKNDTIIIN